MRTCLRCGTTMIEGYHVRIQHSGHRPELISDDILFPENLGTPKAAFCPSCGEISLYVVRITLDKEYLQPTEDVSSVLEDDVAQYCRK